MCQPAKPVKLSGFNLNSPAECIETVHPLYRKRTTEQLAIFSNY